MNFDRAKAVGPAPRPIVSRQEPNPKNPQNISGFPSILAMMTSAILVGAIMFKHVCMILLAGSTFYVWPTWTYLRTNSLLSSGAVMGIEILSCAILLTLRIWSLPAPAPCLSGREQALARRFH